MSAVGTDYSQLSGQQLSSAYLYRVTSSSISYSSATSGDGTSSITASGVVQSVAALSYSGTVAVSASTTPGYINVGQDTYQVYGASSNGLDLIYGSPNGPEYGTYLLADSGRAPNSSVQFSSNNSPFTAPTGPTLTNVSFPTTINITHGAAMIATVGAADVGSTITSVVVTVDRVLQTSDGPTNTITFSESRDSFSDGFSSIARTLTSANAVGHVNIVSISVGDNSRAAISYSNSNLAQFHLQNGFDLAKNAQRSDFTGDGHSDILFQNTNGSVSTWNVSGSPHGTSVTQAAFNASVDSSWHATDTFDMNGDGFADVLFRNDNGALATWTGNGSGLTQAAYYHAPITGDWRVAATGDLNGDGKEDLLWQNVNGSISAWTSTGSGFTENTYNHASPGAGWMVEGMGDFTGDGKADILWRNVAGGVAVWANNGDGRSFNEGTFYQAQLSTGWHIEGVGDFTGDGLDDILFRNDDGAVSVWASTGSGFQQGLFTASAPTSWHVAAVGDFNGDGKADITWQNDNGAVSTWESNGTGFDQAVYNSATATSWHIVGHDYLL